MSKKLGVKSDNKHWYKDILKLKRSKSRRQSKYTKKSAVQNLSINRISYFVITEKELFLMDVVISGEKI